MPLYPVHRDLETAAFLDGTARGEFLIVRDRVTGEYLDPKTDVTLHPDRLEYVPASGEGRVISWALVHQLDRNGQPARIPVGIVELDEGPWWWSELVSETDEDLTGRRVHVDFVRSGDGAADETLPVFRVS